MSLLSRVVPLPACPRAASRGESERNNREAARGRSVISMHIYTVRDEAEASSGSDDASLARPRRVRATFPPCRRSTPSSPASRPPTAPPGWRPCSTTRASCRRSRSGWSRRRRRATTGCTSARRRCFSGSRSRTGRCTSTPTCRASRPRFGDSSRCWPGRLDGAPPEEVARVPDDLLDQLGLSETLGMTRTQGLTAILYRIKRSVAAAADARRPRARRTGRGLPPAPRGGISPRQRRRPRRRAGHPPVRAPGRRRDRRRDPRPAARAAGPRSSGSPPSTAAPRPDPQPPGVHPPRRHPSQRADPARVRPGRAGASPTTPTGSSTCSARSARGSAR